MFKIFIVNVIVGSICMAIVTGCSVKTKKKALVNKEMTKIKEVISSGKILFEDKNFLDEEILEINR
tara:strand:- start:512 stop:709 length:198 start_codon:yes stop_codon:yes gene_type:complete